MKTRRISCSIRCLKDEDVRKARAGLNGKAFTQVPYRCNVSGEGEELLLLAPQCIEKLASIFSPLADPLALAILYALISCELCECDIATLMEQDESQVLDQLDKLHALGLLRRREIQGMKYFTVASEAMRIFLRGSLIEAEGGGNHNPISP